jgi:beta-glucosidase
MFSAMTITPNDLAPQTGLTPDQIAARVDAIIASATLEEKVGMMSGKGFFKQFAESGRLWGAEPYRAGSGVERLNVPALYFTDGPRGVARGQSTCFPVTMARGATFDVDLERRIGEAMSLEIRAQGCNLTGAVCVNLLRHPAWGRAQETYGEDPCHLGEMGAALAEGLQTHNVIATVKHFALNSMENARFKIDVVCDPRPLREVYLPHFKRIIDAGCLSVMSAYNKLNGTYCGQNKALLNDILRTEWGFEGFVHSDWVLGVYSVEGATAGLDIENPEPRVFGRNLVASVQDGTTKEAVIDTACRRILTIQYRLACTKDPLPDYPMELVSSKAHAALALEAAEKSAVLLENNGALPLAAAALKKIAVLGRLADLENTGDNGSSRVRPLRVVTALAGLRAALPATEIVTGEETDLLAVAQAAQDADAIIIVAGYTAAEEGEFIPGDIALGEDSAFKEEAAKYSMGGDRDTLTLPADQVALIKAARAAAPQTPIIVVLVAGSAVMVEEWRGDASAILQTFYAGQEGGTALANLVLGVVSPSGKLPFTVASDAAQYPYFDKNADAITYDLWHGYSKLARDGTSPRYAFGRGLSYTTFAYAHPRATILGDAITIQIDVTNLGAMEADEVVQVYVGPPGQAVLRPAYLLKAFARVSIKAGATQTASLSVPLASLGWWNQDKLAFENESGAHVVWIGGSSDVSTSQSVTIAL